MQKKNFQNVYIYRKEKNKKEKSDIILESMDFLVKNRK